MVAPGSRVTRSIRLFDVSLGGGECDIRLLGRRVFLAHQNLGDARCG
jgi:hypothetical protein